MGIMTDQIRVKAIADLTLHLAVLKDSLTNTAARKPINGTTQYGIAAELVNGVARIEATERAIKYFKKLKIQTPKTTQQ